MIDSFGPLLRSARRAKEMKLQDVANSAHIDLSYLSRIERGTRLAPSRNVRTAIYGALNLSADEICEAEAAVGKKAANTIFSAPLGPGKMIVIVLNSKDLGRLLSDADTGLEKAISHLNLKELEM